MYRRAVCTKALNSCTGYFRLFESASSKSTCRSTTSAAARSFSGFAIPPFHPTVRQLQFDSARPSPSLNFEVYPPLTCRSRQSTSAPAALSTPPGYAIPIVRPQSGKKEDYRHGEEAKRKTKEHRSEERRVGKECR